MVRRNREFRTKGGVNHYYCKLGCGMTRAFGKDDKRRLAARKWIENHERTCTTEENGSDSNDSDEDGHDEEEDDDDDDDDDNDDDDDDDDNDNDNDNNSGNFSKKDDSDTSEEEEHGDTSVEVVIKRRVIILYRWVVHNDQIGMRDARLLCNELRQKRYEVWLDCDNLVGGDPLEEVVYKAISDAEVVLFPLHKGDISDFAMEGDFFRGEMEKARELNKKCLFVVFGNVSSDEIVPKKLRAIPVCEWLKSSLDQSLWNGFDMKYYGESVKRLCDAIDNTTLSNSLKE